MKAALTYTVTVVNHGPAAATEVALTDLLPAEASFVAASANQGSCTRSGKGKRDGLLPCNLGSLAIGAGATVTIVVEPASAGVLTNTATVTATQPDPDPGNNSDTETTTVF